MLELATQQGGELMDSKLGENGGYVDRVLIDCLGKFPCVPDAVDPIVSVNYVIERIFGYDCKANWSKKCRAKARESGLVKYEINLQPCIRLSSVEALIAGMQPGEKS